MSKFFDYPIIKDEMQEIMDIQKELYSVILKFPKMSDEAKWEHIETIKELLEKQEIMWARIKLSDDPQALEMKKQLEKGSNQLGFGDADLSTIFSNMKKTLNQVQKNLKKYDGLKFDFREVKDEHKKAINEACEILKEQGVNEEIINNLNFVNTQIFKQNTHTLVSPNDYKISIVCQK